MPEYIFKCNKCGDLKDKNCNYEARDKQFCECGGKMSMLVEKKSYFIMRRGNPRLRAKIKKMGV